MSVATVNVATRLRQALDPAAFSSAAGFPPDPWQAKVLRSRAPRILLNCSRQSGKSQTAGTLALHTAIYEPGSLTLMLSASLRQSGELFRKMLAVYRALGRPVDAQAETKLSLELENGSRIVSLPGSAATIRGFSNTKMLIVDEGAQVPDDLYVACRPFLAVSNGRLIAMSTPWGQRGWFWEAYRDRVAWEYYEVPADQCPRISPAFLAEERRALGSFLYSQEYECRFLEGVTNMFTTEEIDKVMRHIEQWQFKEPEAY